LKTQQLHQKSIIIDGLNASKHSDPRVIKHLHQGGVTAVNATVAAWHDHEFTIKSIEETIDNVEYNSDIAKVVHNTADILECKKANKVGYILGFQGTMPIGEDLGLIKEYYDLGVRIIQLTYNATNFVGSGCMVEDDKGLTEFGKEVIRELNRLGILIDLSHCGYETTRQAIEYSEKPVAFTHVNPHFICGVKRNKPVSLFELLIKNGGIAGAVGVPALINCNRSTTLGDYINVIDRMVQKLGVDNIALGPDFMEYLGQDTIDTIMSGLPDNDRDMFLKSSVIYGLENASKFNRITDGLKEWDYSDEEVQKILGLNWLRIYEEVW
jgi:membrane dipeptidase